MDDNIDIKSKYMTKITHTHTRVGKEYQAVIPEYNPKSKKLKEEKEKDLKQLTIEHKAHVDLHREEEQGDDDQWSKPVKKRKIEEENK